MTSNHSSCTLFIEEQDDEFDASVLMAVVFEGFRERQVEETKYSKDSAYCGHPFVPVNHLT